MIEVTPKQQIFMQDDVTTRLRRLATHLSQIQSLWTQGSSEDLILALVDESRYFIEWTVPDMVKADDIDRACELVDLVRLLTRWLFHWDDIWTDAEQKQSASAQISYWLQRVLEISRTEPESMSA
ncbi:MAG: hypothetical protein HWQ35_13335 [Nostoc sp. NMS1]|jgi:hypothetical protein|uniref:hypothetical protein n=1 Tax=Nostoc TaxID=1177 RepID=UPI000CF31794|nr:MULTISPECIES: hypothetical protein [Nostoc]AVH64011.1 hypothetical protein NPM_2289 [Nostoc sp. 'Peltigera membranacea cyanobiont' N6]MBN3907501.1 hypothetical protein [Nostoc sp. NMS1]MCC5633811.1 hypothetical protein [Nostoc sphaeroides CHAB 2801]